MTCFKKENHFNVQKITSFSVLMEFLELTAILRHDLSIFNTQIPYTDYLTLTFNLCPIEDFEFEL